MGKYHYQSEQIPQDQRKAINDKILCLIDSGKAEESGITQEDIFNAYTGDGGLHGLTYADYGNYHAYSEAKKEIENGQFFTPAPVCKFILDVLSPEPTETIADLTFGMGNFFNYCPSENSAYGVELDIKAFKIACYLYPSANLTCGDIRGYNPGIKFDYIVGNPPFNLSWWTENGNIISQLYYCTKAAELLKPLGIMAIVVPSSFLADDFNRHYIESLEENFSFLGQFSLKENIFSALGVQNYPTKIQFWQRKSEIQTDFSPLPYSTAVYQLPDLSESTAGTIRQSVIAPAQAFFRKDRKHILLELAKDKESSSDFLYQTKKYLFAIKNHPLLKDKYQKCIALLEKFYHQQKPDDMKWEDWCKIRLTEGKVLAYLRTIVRKQQSTYHEDKITLVKHNYSLSYKAYSPKMQRQLTEDMKQGTPIYRIINQEENPIDYGAYSKLIHRKQREYATEQQKFFEMTIDAIIAEYLENFTVYDPERDEQLYLNDIQKQDINKVLQKKYALLQWGARFRQNSCRNFCKFVSYAETKCLLHFCCI